MTSAHDTRSRPYAPLAKENLTVGMVYAYEAGLKEGARKAREKLLNVIDHEIDQAPEDEHDEDYWRGIAEVHRIIESLRTTAPQSEQAGDHHE